MTFYDRNYSSEIRELAHLLLAIEASQPGGIALFFYSHYPLSAARCREFFTAAPPADGLSVDSKGIALRRDGAGFAVTFSRMPHLASRFDELIEIVSYDYIQTVASAAVADGVSPASAKSLSNQLSKKIYDWLSKQEDSPEAQRVTKFRFILKFITDLYGLEEPVISHIDDNVVVAFWQHVVQKAKIGGDDNASDFKTFEQVADDFFLFYQAQEVALIALRIDQAATIGGDFESGEVNPDTLTQAFCDYSEEEDCIQRLTTMPANQIKFYTNKELDLLAEILEVGSGVKVMPLTLLRKAVWGAHQRRVSEALRRKTAIDELLEVTDLPHYQSYLDSVTALGEHSTLLLKVIAYALNISRGGELCDETTQLAQAWKKINRQGFKEAVCDLDPREPAWLIGAEVIPNCRTGIEAFLQYLTSFISASGGLDAVFASDLSILRANLTAIYRGAHEQ